jgi:hypothetical protein
MILTDSTTVAPAAWLQASKPGFASTCMCFVVA